MFSESHAKCGLTINAPFINCQKLKVKNACYGRPSDRLRPTLRFDSSSQRFPDDTEANALLGRTWRPPFVVPDKI